MPKTAANPLETRRPNFKEVGMSLDEAVTGASVRMEEAVEVSGSKRHKLN
jgi:hypothetical protein